MLILESLFLSYTILTFKTTMLSEKYSKQKKMVVCLMGKMTIYHGNYTIIKNPQIVKGKNTKDFSPGYYDAPQTILNAFLYDFLK